MASSGTARPSSLRSGLEAELVARELSQSTASIGDVVAALRHVVSDLPFSPLADALDLVEDAKALLCAAGTTAHHQSARGVQAGCP